MREKKKQWLETNTEITKMVEKGQGREIEHQETLQPQQ